jgi:hypothetical protein
MLALPPSASLVVTVKEDVPGAVGVPLSTPLLLKLSPVGNVPLVRANA